jgi:hypothetical protein
VKKPSWVTFTQPEQRESAKYAYQQVARHVRFGWSKELGHWHAQVSSGRITVLRTIASSALAVLLVSTLLWGGCLSCSQFFMLTANGSQPCCTPTGQCHRVPAPSPISRDCTIQAIALGGVAPDTVLHPSLTVADAPVPDTAYLVKGSDVNMCVASHEIIDADKRAADAHYDRCVPSLLAFAQRSEAADFAREHGGQVLAFKDAAAAFAR